IDISFRERQRALASRLRILQILPLALKQCLHSDMAVPFLCSLTSLTSSARDGSLKKSWQGLPGCFRRTYGSMFLRFQTLSHMEQTSSFRAEPKTTLQQ